MADVFVLQHVVEKPFLPNSTNYDDMILNCLLLDLIIVSGKLDVILDGEG